MGRCIITSELVEKSKVREHLYIPRGLCMVKGYKQFRRLYEDMSAYSDKRIYEQRRKIQKKTSTVNYVMFICSRRLR
jgi:hypothetical protein